MTGMEGDAPSGRDHIFHDTAQAAALWRRPLAHLATFCEYLDKKLVKFEEPTGAFFHLAHLMPAPSYEFAVGLRIEEGESYRLPFDLLGDSALSLRMDEAGECTFGLAGTSLLLTRLDGITTVGIDDESVATGDVLLHLSVRILDGERHFAVNGIPFARRAVVDADADADAPLTILRGKVHVIAAQSLDGAGRFHWFPTPAPNMRLDEFRDERNPYRFEWGLRSYGVLNVFIAYAVALDMTREPPGFDDPERLALYERMRARVMSRALPNFLLDQILKWSRWRPGATEYPEAGLWDRNSFTNGTIPAAVAILARVTGRGDEQAVIDAFHARGTAFLNSFERTPFSRLRARSTSYWLRRSANHGLVMLTAYLLGSRLLHQEARPDVAAIERMTGELLHKLHEDGSFCEGINYNLFALSYFLPYRALAGNARFGPDLDMRTLEAKLAETFDWLALSHTEGGVLYANFGDNFTTWVRRSSHWAYIQTLADSPVPVPPSYAERKVDELFSFAPPLDTGPRPARGLETRLYPSNRFYLAADFGDDGQRRMGLFVIGSRVQLTHNRNHDCGGFAFFWGRSAVLIPESRREAHLNNVVGIEEDGAIVRHTGGRDYNGHIWESRRDAREVAIGTSTRLNATFSKERRAQWQARTFLLRPDETMPLVVATRIRCAPGVTPFLGLTLRRFATEAGQGLPWVRTFVRRAKGGWQEALLQEDGQLLRAAAVKPAGKAASTFEFLTCFGRGKGQVDPEAIAAIIPRPERIAEDDDAVEPDLDADADMADQDESA